ncbi:questin oxidase family protein [Micromonospora purpureochromogenes]|uniref:questin oxidase family protein n=1 Tax=Micromonospora purpureochromogenes TaxID=47872 RepID=UPI001E4E0B4D|nr:questin oxidase family protein [Micromonospora purpureochromogenes]
MAHGILDEAYRRLHRTGPEFEGWLSNHGPMAVEALVRHGHDRSVHRWLDDYLRRLDELPRGRGPIEDWREALGDPKPAGDWLAHFDRELRERPWREGLGTWWPRLLPGIAAGATHGVIRVGHAVRALREDGSSPDRVAELGQALGYWAARWQPVPGLRLDAASRPDGPEVATALASVPPDRRSHRRHPATAGAAVGRTRVGQGGGGAAPGADARRRGAGAGRAGAPGGAGLPAVRAREPGDAGARGDRAHGGAADPAGARSGALGAEPHRGVVGHCSGDRGVRPAARHGHPGRHARHPGGGVRPGRPARRRARGQAGRRRAGRARGDRATSGCSPPPATPAS